MLKISKIIIAIALMGYGVIMADIFNNECNLTNYTEVSNGWYLEDNYQIIFKTEEEKLKEDGEVIPDNMIHDIAKNAATTWLFEHVANGSDIEEIEFSGMESKISLCGNKRIWIYKIKKINIKF